MLLILCILPFFFKFPLYAVNVCSKIHFIYLLFIAQIFRQNHFIWVPIVPCAQVFSHSVMSNSLQPQGLQHSRLPSPSPSPRACSNSCPLNKWCQSTISSSVIPFSSCPQSSPEPWSLPMSWLFTLDGQSFGALASAPALPMNIQGWFPLELTGLISLLSRGLSKVFSSTTIWKYLFFSTQPSLWSNLYIHTHVWLLEKP